MNPQIQRILDSVQDQAWFQQLRAKWDELDAQSKTYLQWAGAAGSVLLVGWIFIGTAWKVHSLKRDIAEREELIRLVQAANDEMTELKAQIPSNASGGAGTPPPLKDYLVGIAGSANLPAAALELSGEKGGATRESSKETLAQVTLKKINISQLVRFIFQMETGARAIKLRNLNIETHADESGYLDATLQISSFSLKTS
jgi:hypothetical protein